MSPIIKFKAGTCFRIGDTNSVMSDESRGLIYLQEEDGLLHFCHKNLSNGEIDDLIVFPGDASFIKAAPRVYCLKFNSSSTRNFYYFQDLEDTLDNERVIKVNELLGAEILEEVEEETPAATASGDVQMQEIASTETPLASTSTASTSASEATTTAETITTEPSIFGTPDQMSQIQSILASFSNRVPPSSSSSSSSSRPTFSSESQMPSYTLSSILPSSLLLPLISNLTHSSIKNLTSFLPTTLPSTTTSLRTAITSPEFKRSVASLDRALRTGALGPLVQGLGLNSDSAMGVETFLEGIQKQADEINEKEGKKASGNEMQE